MALICVFIELNEILHKFMNRLWERGHREFFQTYLLKIKGVFQVSSVALLDSRV
jgi:hypothetical protein